MGSIPESSDPIDNAAEECKTRPRGLGTRLAFVLSSLLFPLVVAEVIVRATGETDDEGRFEWRGIETWPEPLPVAEHDRLIAPLREGRTPRLIAHERIGWVPNPVPEEFNGLYRANEDGIRCGPDRARYAPRPEPGVMRIILLGDSFTYGDELPYEQTWGVRLEHELLERGRRAEVINLGVSGYGMDQSILRFRETGMALNPTLVIFGMRLENAARNLSIVRLFYKRSSGVPYTKPRFLQDSTGELTLVNFPVLDYEALNRMLHDGSIRDWAALEHDRFAPPFLAPARPWNHSRFLSLLERGFLGARVPHSEEVTDDSSSEASRLALTLLGALDADVRRVGGKLVVLHLSTKSDKQPDDPLLAAIEQNLGLIDTSAVLRRQLKERGATLIRKGGSHYTREACEIIGEFVAKRILDGGG